MRAEAWFYLGAKILSQAKFVMISGAAGGNMRKKIASSYLTTHVVTADISATK